MSQPVICLLIVRVELLSWIPRCVYFTYTWLCSISSIVLDCWRERSKRSCQAEVQRCVWHGHDMSSNAAVSSKGVIGRHWFVHLAAGLFVTSPKRSRHAQLTCLWRRGLMERCVHYSCTSV